MATTIEDTETRVVPEPTTKETPVIPEPTIQKMALPATLPTEMEPDWLPDDVLAGDATLDLVPPICGTLVAITVALLTRAGRRPRTRFVYGLTVFLAGAVWAYYLAIRPRLRNKG